MAAIETLESDVAPPDLVWMIGEGAVPSAVSGSVSPLPSLGEGAPPAPVRPDDTVAILYTSGTTGPSKGVCCPQAQMFWWGVYSARALDIREGDVLFTTLPLFHTNALNAFYQALLNGCTYALEPKFSASGFCAAARRPCRKQSKFLKMRLLQPQSRRIAISGAGPAYGDFNARLCAPARL